MTLALALGGGLLIGLLLGTLGAGGSVLAVPVLVYGLGLGPYVATTGSLVVVGTTALVGAVAAHRRGALALDRGLLFGLAAVAGTVVGARLSRMVAEELLMAGFAVLLVVAAVVMVARPRTEDRDAGPVVSFRPWRCECPRALKVAVAATVVGLLTGFLGVGGGFLLVPALVMALGLDLRTATGTSLVAIALTSAVALTTRLVDGAQVPWSPVVALTAAALVAALVGGRLAHRLPTRGLQAGFVVLLLVVAGYTGWQSLPGLA